MRSNRRWPVILAPILPILLLLGACGSSSKNNAADSTTTTIATKTFEAGSTMAKLQAAGTITVGTKFDQALFGLKDPRTGDVVGFDAEIARLIAARLGPKVTVKFVETPSAIRETSIEQGTVDMVVATYTINDTRKTRIDFAGPYYVAGQDIMVRAEDTSIKSVADLNGKTVCSVQGSTSIANIKKFAPQATTVEYDIYSKCTDDLHNKRVDAVSTDNVILVGQIASATKGEFKLVGKPFTTEPYGIGVKKGDTAFRAFINDVLDEIYANGQWAKAYKDTVGTVSSDTPTPPAVNRY
jgi:glutamate transport system substrate-binding protein